MENKDYFEIRDGEYLGRYSGLGGVVEIPQGVKRIGSNAFYKHLRRESWDGRLITSLTIPEGVEVLCWLAFNGLCNVKELVIPSTTIRFEESCFDFCNGFGHSEPELTRLVFLSGIAKFDEKSFGHCNRENLSIVAPYLNIDLFPSKVRWCYARGFLKEYDQYPDMPREVVEGFVKWLGRYKRNTPEDLFKDMLLFLCRFGKLKLGEIDDYLESENVKNDAELVQALQEHRNVHYSSADIAGYQFSEKEKKAGKRALTVSDYKKIFKFRPLDDETLEIYGYKSEDQDMEIPETIGKKKVTAVSDIRDLKIESVVFPSTVRRIGDYAFANCDRLKTVTLPESLKQLGKGAFSKCEELEKVVLPDHVMLSAEVFSGCDKLELQVSQNNAFFTVEDNVVYTKDKRILVACFSRNPDFTVPQEVERINSYAFARCKTLKNITVLNKTELGKYAFAWCENLEQIEFKENPDALPKGCFYGCRSLQSFPLEGVTVIGEDCFREALHGDLEIPDSVGEIGNGAFQDSNIENVVIGKGVKEIPFRVFCGSLISTVSLPGTLKYIGGAAFAEAKKLKSVEIPDSVDAIGGGVFQNCTALESLRLSAACKNYYDYTFLGCSSLRVLEFPEGTEKLGYHVLDYSIKEVHIPDSLRVWEDLPPIQYVASENSYFYMIAKTRETRLIPYIKIKGKEASAEDDKYKVKLQIAGLEKEAVCFYTREEPYGFLCSDYAASFMLDGMQFSSVNQYYLYQKCRFLDAKELADEIMATDDAELQKKTANRFQYWYGEPRPSMIADVLEEKDLWNELRSAFLLRGTKAKFAQNENLRRQLLETGDAWLVACSQKGDDPFESGSWPVDGIIDVAKWKRKNILGFILMEVRKELKTEE